VVKQVARASAGTVTTKVRLAVTVDEVDQLLESWIRTVLGEVSVTLASPQEAQTGVSLYLLDLAHAPLTRAVKDRPPHRIMLRYLITAQGTEPHEIHRRLGELLFAALDSPELEVETEPLPEAVWTALNLVPRPSLVLRVPLLRERSEERLVPLVRTPLVVKSAAICSLSGVVRGPGDIGILGARVELPALNLFTATDLRGRFHFATVPSEPPVKVLRVKAKGRTISVPVDRPEEEVVIHLNESEI
jgi:hypothetical protein